MPSSIADDNDNEKLSERPERSERLDELRLELTRCRWHARRRHRRTLGRLDRTRKTLRDQLQQTRRQLDAARRQVAQLRQDLEDQRRLADRARPTPLDGPGVFGHRYTAAMVAMMHRLTTSMGCRTAKRALRIVLRHLQIDAVVPDRETPVRWAERLGVDRLVHNRCPRRWWDRGTSNTSWPPPGVGCRPRRTI